jgi:hypothetical protein
MNKTLLLVFFLSLMIVSIQSVPIDGNNEDSNDDWDLGCTLSCGIWNGCRILAMKSGNLNSWGPMPLDCDCTHFSG